MGVLLLMAKKVLIIGSLRSLFTLRGDSLRWDLGLLEKSGELIH
jgi:hypothetical protein